MPITFHCPQGHRLTCPDELSGKPGKCPKCGVVVRVPQTGMAVAVASASQAGAAPADEPASALESAAEGMTGSDLGADQILFLCPNGHRLHGSASLAGRPGQCPHCSVKFLVPSPDDDEEDERIIEEEPDAPLNDIVIQIDTSGKGGSSKSGKSNAISGSALAAAANPLASLLAQLWRHKAQGATVEIHLGDGKLLQPDHYSLKDPHHAIFASREAGGAHTLTAVAWSSIERIVVRGLAQLPKEWF